MESFQSNPKEDEDFSSLSLRPFNLSNMEDFMAWATDPKVVYFCSWELFTNEEDFTANIQNSMAFMPWFRAICLNNRAIGAISLVVKSGNDKCRAEIGYVLASNYWGKGIVTKAVNMASKSIFSDWPHLESLEALVDIEHLGSQRVLEKAGFKRDMAIFSLLSTNPLL